MSSSSDLETGITQQILKKKDKKSKKKSETRHSDVAPVDGHGKNEGDDPNRAYAPPAGAVLLDHNVVAGPFEWDALKNDEDTEIWLIRIPDTIKTKHLNGLDIDSPSSSRTARIGGITRKTESYDVWSIGEDDADVAGGEELRGLSCLLPRKRKHGKLYIAPRRISHRIVVSKTPTTATPPENQPVVYQNPPRTSYLKDMFKHAFVPYGARSKQTESEDASMDVDVTVPTREKPAKAPKSKDSKGKKRKVEGETPKKSKKHKTESDS